MDHHHHYHHHNNSNNNVPPTNNDGLPSTNPYTVSTTTTYSDNDDYDYNYDDGYTYDCYYSFNVDTTYDNVPLPQPGSIATTTTTIRPITMMSHYRYHGSMLLLQLLRLVIVRKSHIQNENLQQIRTLLKE